MCTTFIIKFNNNNNQSLCELLCAYCKQKESDIVIMLTSDDSCC